MTTDELKQGLEETGLQQRKDGRFLDEQTERLFQEGLRNRPAVPEPTPPATGLTAEEEADLRTVCEHTPGSDFEKIKGKMESDPIGLAKLRVFNARHG